MPRMESNVSPVHSLAFKRDPLYIPLCNHVDENYQQGFIDIRFDLTVNCHDAIELF